MEAALGLDPLEGQPRFWGRCDASRRIRVCCTGSLAAATGQQGPRYRGYPFSLLLQHACSSTPAPLLLPCAPAACLPQRTVDITTHVPHPVTGGITKASCPESSVEMGAERRRSLLPSEHQRLAAARVAAEPFQPSVPVLKLQDVSALVEATGEHPHVHLRQGSREPARRRQGVGPAGRHRGELRGAAQGGGTLSPGISWHPVACADHCPRPPSHTPLCRPPRPPACHTSSAAAHQMPHTPPSPAAARQ